MKELLGKYAAYNLWANSILLDKSSQLSVEILHKDLGSSFASIYKTFVHMMEVESAWWQRIKLQERIQLPEKDADENFAELSTKLIAGSKQWSEWVREANEKNLTHVFGYQNTKKEYFKQPVYEMLLHLFNHQTYHRGQIVTMMRQAGVEKIPATDFIVYCRKK